MNPSGDRAWLWASLLMLLAAVPRFYDLGGLSFWGTEDYTVLASRGIIEGGAPHLPSGAFYPRAIPYSYTVAAVIAFLGESEFSARFLSAICSTLSVCLLFFFARRVFGLELALLAGGVMALSGWEILMGRLARMYAPLSFFVLATAWLTYLVVYDGRKRYRILCLLCAGMACFLHQVAGALIAPFAALLFLTGVDKSTRRFVVVTILVISAATGGVMAFEKHHYRNKGQLIRQSRVELNLPHGEAGDRVKEGASPEDFFALLTSLRDRLDVPASVAAMGIGTLAVAVAFLGWFASGSILLSAVLCFTVLATGLHQAMAAFYLGLGFGLVSYFRWEPHWARRTGLLLGLTGAGTMFWLAVGTLGPEAFSLRETLRLVVGYPTNFLLHYAAKYPLMFLVGMGAVLVLLQALREGRAPDRVYIAVLLAGPPSLLGLHPQSLEHFFERYAFYLHPYFILLYAYGLFWLMEHLTKLCQTRFENGRGYHLLRLVVLVLLLFVTRGIDPIVTLAAVEPDHGLNHRLQNAYGRPLLVPDNRTTSRFVCRHAAPDDLIVASDILAHAVYCPRADIQLTTSTKGDAEGWIGVPSLHAPKALVAMLRAREAKRAWIVMSSLELRNLRKSGRDDVWQRFFESPCLQRVSHGQDGLSAVYLLEKPCIAEIEHAWSIASLETSLY